MRLSGSILTCCALIILSVGVITSHCGWYGNDNNNYNISRRDLLGLANASKMQQFLVEVNSQPRHLGCFHIVIIICPC